MDAELYQGDYVKDGGEFFDPTSRKAAKKAGHGAKPAHLRGLSKVKQIPTLILLSFENLLISLNLKIIFLSFLSLSYRYEHYF